MIGKAAETLAYGDLYLAHGLPIVLCTPGGKLPLTDVHPHGVRSPITSSDALEAALKLHPDANIALAMGGGLFAVDVDPGGEEAIRRFGKLPRTIRQRTPRGGFHAIFATNGHQLGCPDVGRNVNGKGEGGYILVEPSVGANGVPYKWRPGRSPLEIAPAPLPQAILDRLLAKQRDNSNGVSNVSDTRIDFGVLADPETVLRLAVDAGLDAATYKLIVEGHPDSSDRSRVDHRVLCALLRLRAQLTPAQVRALFARYPIGAKYRENDDRYLARSIRAAQADVQRERVGLSALFARVPALTDDALHGLAGEIIQGLLPHTEADPAALLGHLLAMFGNAAGRAPHVMIGATRHEPRLFVGIVAATGKGRKGVARDEIARLFSRADRRWTEEHMTGGLSSGEALIWTVRDQILGYDAKKGAMIITDPGVADKRLCVIETELGRTMTAMRREGSVLSHLVRQAWDSGNLANLSRATNARATGAHISIIGHVTMEELREKLSDLEAWNGFANRFLWLHAVRSKLLPRGGRVPEKRIARLSAALKDSFVFARSVGEMDFDRAGGPAWDAAYQELSAETPGLLGAITARAEPQVLRLAMIYGLLDRSALIGAEHVRAALAVWHYAEATARMITGGRTGDSDADRLLAQIREKPCDRNALRHLFGGHMSSEELSAKLALLEKLGLVKCRRERTKGRPREVWHGAERDGRNGVREKREKREKIGGGVEV